MLPGFKPTAELKIWGELPQSSVRGLALDPKPLSVPSNQSEFRITLFYGTRRCGSCHDSARALLRAWVRKTLVEESMLATIATVRK